MSLSSSLLKHTRNYSLASILTTLAGLVSFPILTRALDVADYGVMSLVSSALALAVGLGKLGMQHATLRFYADAKAGKMPGVTGANYAPTVLYGMAAMGAVATVGWLVASLAIPTRFWDDPRVPGLMLLTAALVQVRVIDSALFNLLRAQERSGLSSVLSVVRRYVSLTLILASVLLISRSVWGFFGATVVAEGLLIVGSLWWVLRGQWPRPRDVSPDLLKSMIVFAIPMTGYELASVVLQMGDRYVQQSVLGAEAVGLYAAAYNLCDYIKLALFTAFASAALPMCTRLYAEQGRVKVEDFLILFSRAYLLITLWLVAVVSSVSAEMLAILASPKYQAGAKVIPLIITGMVFEAYISMAAIGLYLKKRSLVSMSIVAAGALLNVVLNLWLVPQMGILGSGVANVLSYLGIVLVAQQASRTTVHTPSLLEPVLKFGALSAMAGLAALQIDVGSHVFNLVLRSVLVTFIYFGLAMLFDSRTVEMARLALGWMRAKLARRLGPRAHIDHSRL